MGICPVVKRIWTPSWTLYSGGLVLLLLSVFYAVMEWRGKQKWAFPLLVVGMNSIAIYVMSGTTGGFVRGMLDTLLGKPLFSLLSPAFAPVVRGSLVLAVLWLILYWMYKRKIFIRI
jgi:predicted acyltransferase